MVSGDVSTPGHGQGEGPDGYKLFAKQMTQETLGGAGAKRSPSDTRYPSPFYEPMFSWISSVRLWMIS